MRHRDSLGLPVVHPQPESPFPPLSRAFNQLDFDHAQSLIALD
jgi:hypothetical protein